MRVPTRRTTKVPEADDPIVTQEKMREMENRLALLKKRRPIQAAEVSRLAELGDFSENVEYQLAKGRLRRTNEQILRLEYQIRHAQVIVPKSKVDFVQIGSTVVVSLEGKEKTFRILGSSETRPNEGIISYSSPIGRALLGKKTGESAEVPLPRGKKVYMVVKIF